jgi:hypothetical protein
MPDITTGSFGAANACTGGCYCINFCFVCLPFHFSVMRSISASYAVAVLTAMCTYSVACTVFLTHPTILNHWCCFQAKKYAQCHFSALPIHFETTAFRNASPFLECRLLGFGSTWVCYKPTFWRNVLLLKRPSVYNKPTWRHIRRRHIS